MRQFRIVAEPNFSGGTRYKIQGKGCGPFSFFWHDEGYNSLGFHFTITTWYGKEADAVAAIKNLRHYWNGKTVVVKTYGCGEAE